MSEPTRFDARAMFERQRTWHEQQARLPLREKVRILLLLQRQELPLLKRLRRLEAWERPWEIEP
jgi:hypothetical protein